MNLRLICLLCAASVSSSAMAQDVDPLAMIDEGHSFVGRFDGVALRNDPALKNLFPAVVAWIGETMNVDAKPMYEFDQYWSAVGFDVRGSSNTVNFIEFSKDAPRDAYLKTIRKMAEKLPLGELKELTYKDRSYLKVTPPFGEETCFLTVSNSNLLQATEANIHAVIDAPPKRKDLKLVKLLAAQGKAPLVAALDLSKIGEPLVSMLPPPVRAFQQADAITLRFDPASKTPGVVKLIAPNEGIATQLESSTKGLYQMGALAAKQSLDSLKFAGPWYHLPLSQFGVDTLKSLKVARKENEVSVTIGQPDNFAQLPDLIAFAHDVQKTDASLRIARHLGFAMVQWRKAGGKLDNLRDPQGKALFSWRVGILPHLPETESYGELKLDRAWDDDHNELILSEKCRWIADLMRTSQSEGVALNTTWKLVPGQPGGVMLVQGGIGSRTKWYEPDEVKLDANNLLAPFGEEPDDGYIVVLTDGRPTRLSGAELRKKLGQAN